MTFSNSCFTEQIMDLSTILLVPEKSDEETEAVMAAW